MYRFGMHPSSLRSRGAINKQFSIKYFVWSFTKPQSKAGVLQAALGSLACQPLFDHNTLGVASVTGLVWRLVASRKAGTSVCMSQSCTENENWRTCRRGVSSIERPEKRVYTFRRTGRGESSIERLDERVDTSS
jgi:hypothetical protein